MSDLVKRLRNFVEHNGSIKCVIEAADRIEHLERELAFWQNREAYVSNAFTKAQADLKEAHDQLAAEKALADELLRLVNDDGGDRASARAAYRKARGL